ncbi:MAG: class I SAM-dependent methyltransferase [Acidobacteriota bacterium]
MTDERPPRAEIRRTGDAIAIPGSYQFDALHTGFVVQRYWHHLKIEALERAAPPCPDEVVIDIGCGSGVIADRLASRAREVHALDANPSAIEFARRQFPRSNLHFHLGLADEADFGGEMFDRIYLLEFIEHLYWEQLVALFGRLATWLKPGGTVFLTTPNYHSAWPLVEHVMDLLHLTPEMHTAQHVSRATRRRLTDLARQCGFEQEQIGRVVGLAPFVSPLGWRLAERVDALERLAGCPLGHLLYALWRKA